MKIVYTVNKINTTQAKLVFAASWQPGAQSGYVSKFTGVVHLIGTLWNV